MTTKAVEIEREIRHGHLFCGIGAGAKGFNRGAARVGTTRAKSVCVGGIDVDPAACRDFERIAGVPATCMDLFTREQHIAFHGRPPPAGWREAVPHDISAAFGGRRPHIVFLSAPCKGFSGLLSEANSKLAKYQALNGLTLRALWLLLEEYRDDPVELIIFENVPRITTRGRPLLDQIIALLRSFGYAVAESTHDCGELGGLGQSRKRFLLVARHQEKVPAFLYEPPKHRLLGVGEVLEKLPMPLSGLGGPMHRMPALQWNTWVRLAFVRAGGDWRSLNELEVEGGVLRDYGIMPTTEWFRGAYGVKGWKDVGPTVTYNGRPAAGAFAVADPREVRAVDFHGLRVNLWGQTAAAITTQRSPGSSAQSVADPRPGYGPDTRKNVFRVVPWANYAGAVSSGHGPSSGGQAVADPRFAEPARSPMLGVKGWDETANLIAGQSYPSNGSYSVADPRPVFTRGGREVHQTAGHYGVVRWRDTSRAVFGHGSHDNGFNSVADPRDGMSSFPSSNEEEKSDKLPIATDRLICIILALDQTWHRPFTTLELAALQGLVDPEEQFELDGLSDSAWRERTGNCVPPPSAQAIANVMFETLLLAWSGTTFTLSSTPIWVRDIAVSLSVRPQEMPSW